MTSENIKRGLSGRNLLRYFLALVFLSAGLFRIFNPAAAARELADLKLPLLLSYPLIALEIGAAILLLSGRNLRKTYYFLVGFLSLALLWGLFINGADMLRQAGELFVFRTDPTDFFLHIVFLLVTASLLTAQSED